MLARGEWRAQAEFAGVVGFHISELYSPWVRWSEMVTGFLKAKRLPETLKVWVNTSLGETWKEASEGIDASGLLGRKENWGRVAPAGVVPDIPGLEVAGVVEVCGSEVTQWKPGDRVCALLPGGGYAEYASAVATHCLPIPDHLSFAEAAGLPEALAAAREVLPG